ncbi:hypothetical protein [Fulvivirga kasyanovii]|uniref:Uncharacterized protein n=1 Tax=Fulvivirga kasyanovii TaxID=396812 RepID=A0ABW9RID5_9BACT|nr:hypothetical protein [Fulvivirga kasyanovii]MTI23758.1 hypothetical protein [Fulvivirga kasyanovii]
MKDILELPEKIDLKVSTDNSDKEMESSLRTVRQWMKVNKELHPVIQQSIDSDHREKYTQFHHDIERILIGLEDFIKEIAPIKATR